jgi:uncharacterized damage-inducible protein DinB
VAIATLQEDAADALPQRVGLATPACLDRKPLQRLVLLRRQRGKRTIMDTGTARLFAQYRAWADELTYAAVAALPPGEATKQRPTLFKNMIGTLNHNYLIDRVWQAHLEGRDHGFTARNLVLHADLAELRAAQQTITRWYIDWAAAQSEATLAEPVRFRFIGGEESTMRRGAILLHVVNHATYHRGWIAEMFFQVPAQNPATDLPVFLSDPARR